MDNATWKKSGYIAGIGFGIIFVTAFIFSQIIFPIVLGRPQTIETPDVTGLGLAQAKRIMNEEKLHVVVKDSLYSETERIDQVLEQHPKPGDKIKQDGTVYLIVSKGSKMVSVPSLIGSQFQEALISLRNSSLRSAVIDSLYSDSDPVDTVMRMSPSPGSKVEKNSLIRLYLSRGKRPMPDSLNASSSYYY